MISALLNHHHDRADSPVHRMSAPAKLLIGLGIIAGTVLLPLRSAWDLVWLLPVAGFVAAGWMASRISVWFGLKRLLLLSPFVLGVALVNALHPAARGSWAVLAAKSALCLVTVILISNTTPFGRTLGALRTVRVPSLLITTAALMHRYLFVMAEESGRMQRARLSRTFGRQRRWRWQSLSTMVGQLFMRASERAGRVYQAMCARGWR